jgi:hypothetical protein
MNGYVIACYALTIGTLVAYSLWTLSRFRAVNKRGPRP